MTKFKVGDIVYCNCGHGRYCKLPKIITKVFKETCDVENVSNGYEEELYIGNIEYHTDHFKNKLDLYKDLLEIEVTND